MKLTGLICTFPLLLSVTSLGWFGNSGRCSSTAKRYDFELVDDEVRNTYFDTFRKWALMKGRGSLHEFVEIHDVNERTSHGVSCFLVWHRKFLKDAEDALRAINPNFVFLYWNWSRDYQKPHLAKVWDARYLGTNGKGPDKIVRDGVMGNITCMWPRSRPHLLKRDFKYGETLPPFTAPSLIQDGLSKSRNFYDAWKQIETIFHPTPHNSIGGMDDNFDRNKIYGDATTMYSPNDPFFWMHHAFIDMLWYSWQKKNAKENDYSGFKIESMRPWNARVSDYLNSEAYPVCTTYDRNFLDQDLLPNPDPKATVDQFARSSPTTRSIKSIAKLTDTLLSTVESLFNYTSTKTKNYIVIGKLIDLGEIPNFRVKNHEKNIPHPDIILESPPLSDHFIEMNHLNVAEVRAHEADNSIMAQAINSQLAMNDPNILRWFEKIWDEES